MVSLLFTIILMAVIIGYALQLYVSCILEKELRRLYFHLEEVYDEIHKTNELLTIIDFRLREIVNNQSKENNHE